MRTILLTLVMLSLSPLVVHGQYEKYGPAYRHILAEDFAALKEETLKTLKASQSVQKSQAALRLLLSQENELYNVQSFDSKIVTYNKGGCVPGEHEPQFCGKYGGHSFFLQNTQEGQQLSVRYKGSSVFTYDTKKRTSLKDSLQEFGTVIHIISPLEKPESFFFLLREIEQVSGVSVKQVINIYKVQGDKLCRIAESDFTITDDHYALFSVFIRALGEKVACSDHLLVI